MLSRLRTYFEDRALRRQMRQWRGLTDAAQTMNLADLRDLRRQAKQLRRQLDAVNHLAGSRLTLPVLGSNAFRKPARTDWAHRPEAWRGPVTPLGIAGVPTKTRIGSAITVFHDCKVSELSFRQVRNTGTEDLAPFGLRLDVFNFDGSFLSLAVDMPPDALDGLKRSHLLRLDMIIESERPQEMFARLNIRHGPNTEQIVREIEMGSREVSLEFDLYYTQFNETRGEAMWIDLIFEGPSMNQIWVRDMTLIRRPRANI